MKGKLYWNSGRAQRISTILETCAGHQSGDRNELKEINEIGRVNCKKWMKIRDNMEKKNENGRNNDAESMKRD